VIEAVGSEAVGTGAQRSRARTGDVVRAVARLQPGADEGVPGHGPGPVGRLLTGLVDGPRRGDEEFHTVLLAELARRYLRVVRGHTRRAPLPRVWQVVLDGWEGLAADPVRVALAGAHALVAHDLAPSVVSASTVLGRVPARAERAVVHAVAERIAGLAEDAAAGADAATRDHARGLALLCSRGEGWRQAEHLWAVRGRPSEAERERAALDWRAALVAEALLAPGC